MTPTISHQPLDTLFSGLGGIAERVCGPSGPLVPPHVSGYLPALSPLWWAEQLRTHYEDTLNWLARMPDPSKSPTFRACGIEWDKDDILRFLSKCEWQIQPGGNFCLVYYGARSRGKGNKAWYGTFWTKGQNIRAHKFAAVTLLGMRPRPNRLDELDHLCFNTRCVSCLDCVPREVNQQRIRRGSKT